MNKTRTRLCVSIGLVYPAPCLQSAMVNEYRSFRFSTNY